MKQKDIMGFGGGGREHALVSLLQASPQVGRVWCYPGNGGTDMSGETIKASRKLDDPVGLYRLADSMHADFAFVGPELPAVSGIADLFAAQGKPILCPSRDAAKLEGCKIFAKRFMKKYEIPTAEFMEYYSAEDIRSAAKKFAWRCAVKADGLCGGKGVYVCTTSEEVEAAIVDLLEERKYGTAGESGVVEDLLPGIETSSFWLADGTIAIDCGTAGDHKRAFDDDKGPNTGGMGAFWPCPYVTKDKALQSLLYDIAQRTVLGMRKEGSPFRGFLYLGLMLTQAGPQVLEYNVRFGDPEAQVVIPSIDTNLTDPYELLYMAATGSFQPDQRIHWRPGTRVGVVLVSNSYPGKEPDGWRTEIHWNGPFADGVHIYHGATVYEGHKHYATSGRVLTVSAPGATYQQAIDLAYATAKRISFHGMRYRTDIGMRAVAVAA